MVSDAGCAADFCRGLDANGRAIMRYWCAKRQPGGCAYRRAIDPLELPVAMLPLLQIHERLPDGRYICRLAGTMLAEVYGQDPTGRTMDQMIGGSAYRSRVAMFDLALASGRPVHYRSQLLVPGREHRQVERLILPLADADGTLNAALSLLKFPELERTARGTAALGNLGPVETPVQPTDDDLAGCTAR